MPNRTVAVLGGVVQNLTIFTYRIPEEGETVNALELTKAPGGKGSNSAVATYRLSRPNPQNQKKVEDEVETEPEATAAKDSLELRMIGAVGRDEFGPALKKHLEECGINVDGVREMDGQTAVSNIIVDKLTGANRIIQYPGVSHKLTPAEFMTVESLGGGVRPDFIIAQLEIKKEAVEQAIETAWNAGIEVLLNPSPAHFILSKIYPMVSHLVMNETEAIMLSNGIFELKEVKAERGWKTIADDFHERGVTTVVITLGEEGVYYSGDKGNITGFVDAEKDIQVVDSAGAGDSFVGAYVAKYMEQKDKGNWDIEAAIKYGCKASARVIEMAGCLHPIAWADEVDIPRRKDTSKNESISTPIADSDSES